ncbi:MAG: hypothetical protein JNL96_01385 [Planctomycetaceae bacterium]|nr:hypothetical protein [Planctomycetaceae bacterium]
MSDQEKKSSRWDSLAEQLGIDAKSPPQRPASAPPKPIEPPATVSAPAADVAPAKRSGWEELTSWLGIGGSKKERPAEAQPKPAPSTSPPEQSTAENPSSVAERPVRESAFRTEPLPRPEVRQNQPRPTEERKTYDRPRREVENCGRQEGPAMGSRGREFDDFRDALQEERAELGVPREIDAEMIPGETPRSGERSEGDRPRRRRRRGGRGRNRAERSDAGRRGEPRGDYDRGPADARDFPPVEDDAESHDDMHLSELHGDDVDQHDLEADGGDSNRRQDTAGRADHGDDERRGRRRRRRRRGGRDRLEGGGTSSSQVAGARGDDFDDDVDHPPKRDNRILHDSADVEHAAGDDHESDHDAVEDFHHAHKGIPTWDEAVGVLINANLESRARNPHTPGGHRGGGRHRGGRGGERRH